MAKSIFSPEAFFKSAQSPEMWFLSTERLRDASEVILRDQLAKEQPYFAAVQKASAEAQLAAIKDTSGSAYVDIARTPPNYLPAQLLYAFAMENALKGLIVARNPELISPNRISKKLNTHALITAADNVGFLLAVQEIPVLQALSRIAMWTGRYPAASTVTQHTADRPLGSDPQ
jgi:hypothetical protein